jgi:hypothetical protein
MRTLLLWLLAALLPFGVRAQSGVGINLDQPTYWSTDWMYIDQFKRAETWFTQCDERMPTCRDFPKDGGSWNTLEQSKLELDENGWVKRLPAADDPKLKYRFVAAVVRSGGTHPTGTWVVLYDGQGQLDYDGSVRKVDAKSKPGRDVVEVIKPDDFMVRIKRTVEGNHLRNIRVIPPGGVCADAPAAYVADARACKSPAAFKSLEQLHATQSFHPAFLADMRGFRSLRFMKMSGAIASRLVRWDQRPRLTDAMWSSGNGIPFEAMFEMANSVGADPWIALPPPADDDFVRQFARLAKQSMKPGSNLILEYGNEPWNSAPPYNEAGNLYEKNAKAKWPGAGRPAWEQRLNWYAYRSVQVCRIAKKEFGAEASRVKCVVNSQAANAEVAEVMLECKLARDELGGACSRSLDALAIAPYFGHYIGDWAYLNTVDAWPDLPDRGVGKVFEEIFARDAQGKPVTPPLWTPKSGTPREGALEQAKWWVAANKKVADRHGLPLYAYEGGQHLTVYRNKKTDAMFVAANRDPRMGLAFKRLLDDWKDGGGQLYVAFSYVGRPGSGNYWGLKEVQTDQESPKWQAYKAWRDAPCWWKGCARP